MIPVIALVGRPNVGKSTLFNYLTGSREALVANFPGLTRDRKYGETRRFGRRAVVIDTGGLTGDEEGIDFAMAEQSLRAIDEADIVLFMVDCRDGLTPTDFLIAAQLRESNKNLYLVANKIDGLDPDVAVGEFYQLGLDKVYPISSAHGRGVRKLFDSVFPEPESEPSGDEPDAGESGIRMAVVGRPNVGKSTLVNRMLGEERVVVFDQPGTTRDSVYIQYERNGRPYTLIDTAGVRRRKNIKLAVEKFSIVKTLQAVADANVVILLLDGSENLVDQDLHLMGHVIDAGKALVVAVNKWDGLDDYQRQQIRTELNRRLRFVDYADVHFISALHGTNVGHLYESVELAYTSATEKFSTNQLTKILEAAVEQHQPPLVQGHRIKLRYAHTGGHNPPIIVIHGNQTASVPAHYTRYLEKTFRKQLNLHGTPLRIEYKTGDNPFSGRKNQLTRRQVTKKRRLMSKVKKK